MKLFYFFSPSAISLPVDWAVGYSKLLVGVMGLAVESLFLSAVCYLSMRTAVESRLK